MTLASSVMERLSVKQRLESDLQRYEGYGFYSDAGILQGWKLGAHPLNLPQPETHSARLNISDRRVKFNASHETFTPSLKLLRELKCQCYFLYVTELWIQLLSTVSKVQLTSQLLAAVGETGELLQLGSQLASYLG